MTTTTPTTLPVLDLSRLGRGPEEADAFRRDLREATHDVGFLLLTGHGVPDDLQRRLLEVSRAFFALPEAEKLAIENVTSPHFRGYTRLGGERTQGKVDLREQIDIAPEREAIADLTGREDYWVLEGPNLWPERLPALRETVLEWQVELERVARTLLAAWAESLGAAPDVFDPGFERPSTLVKIIRYPGAAEAEPRQGVGSHKDAGVLTLLWVEPGKAGLQVEHDGDWIDAPPLDGAFVVNIGELLEVATDGYLRATVHRVVSPAPGEERISVPFFFNPALDARIPRLELPAGLRARARGVEQEASNRIHDTYGENALKSRLRAHPDVAAIHHPEIVARRAG